MNSDPNMSSRRRTGADLVAIAMCFFAAALLCLLLAWGLASPFTAFRTVVNGAGEVVLGPDGKPMYEFNYWTNVRAHWPENLSLVASVVFAFTGVLIVIRLILKSLSKGSHNEQDAQQVVAPNRSLASTLNSTSSVRDSED